jgi:hypothetical protein
MQHALDALLDEGFALFTAAVQGHHGDHPLTYTKKHAPYQSWYTKALRVIRQLYPELADDFQAHYRALLGMQNLTKKPSWYRKALRAMHKLTGQRFRDATGYLWGGQDGKQAASDVPGSHACLGMAVTRNGDMPASVHLTFLARLHQQLRMLNAVRDGLEHALTDVQSTLYDEVSDHILAAAYKLFRRGQHRAAGALAGVVLETHLAKVAVKYGVNSRHSSLDFAVLNTALKRGGIYDGSVWRFIRRLEALGHACVYAPAPELGVDALTEFLHGVQLIRRRVR